MNDFLAKLVSSGWLSVVGLTLSITAIALGVFARRQSRERRTRLARGLCPICTYPIGTSPTCTECGVPLREESISSAKARSS